MICTICAYHLILHSLLVHICFRNRPFTSNDDANTDLECGQMACDSPLVRRRKTSVAPKKKLTHVNDRKRPSKEKKQYSAGNHLHIFIQNNHDQFPHLGINESTDADELPYAVVNDDDFVGKYLDWLAKDATKLEDPEKKLMLNSILGYASSFKDYYTKKILEQTNTHPISIP